MPASKPKERTTLMLDPFRVKPFADQPRKRFRGIPQLAESIRLVGQVTPIVVTACDENGFDAELVDGERRLQACRAAKLKVRAVMGRSVGQAERFALSIAANFCRQDHDCIEIASAIERLKADGWSVEDIAGIFGKAGCWAYQHLSLLKLHPDVQDMLKRAGDEQRESRVQRRGRGRMTFSIAMLLTPLAQSVQLRTAQHIVKRKLSMVAARNYVQAIAAAKGTKVGQAKSPKHSLKVLWNALDAFRHRVDRYASLSHAQLALIVESAKAREASTMAGQIDEVCDSLKLLARELRKASGQ